MVKEVIVAMLSVRLLEAADSLSECGPRAAVDGISVPKTGQG